VIKLSTTEGYIWVHPSNIKLIHQAPHDETCMVTCLIGSVEYIYECSNRPEDIISNMRSS
jgi:hypothetical protein